MGPNILEHTNRISIMTMDIYLLIIKKDSKTLATNNRPRRLINGNLERKMRKNTKRTFQSKRLADFSRLRLDADNVSYGHTCRKYPDIADQTS